MDGWTDIMYKIRFSSNSYTYDFFFILAVIVGAFFVINLITAIQFFYYDKIKEE
jgi:hypothetical protein